MTHPPVEHAARPTARARWRWSHFFAGTALTAVLAAPTAFISLRLFAVVCVLLGGVALWYVASGRARTHGPAFVWGLVAGVPVAMVGLFLFIAFFLVLAMVATGGSGS